MIIIDLEATCCDLKAFPDSEREAIEIGAVDTLGGSFDLLVKPVRHPTLTAFCKSLTGITQGDVDHACGFVEAIRSLIGWRKVDTFYSWGGFDEVQLKQDCEYHGIDYPFHRCVNLADVFRRGSGIRAGRPGAMRHLGLTPKGRNHRGLDDATNIAAIAVEMHRREWL